MRRLLGVALSLGLAGSTWGKDLSKEDCGSEADVLGVIRDESAALGFFGYIQGEKLPGFLKDLKDGGFDGLEGEEAEGVFVLPELSGGVRIYARRGTKICFVGEFGEEFMKALDGDSL